MYQGRGGESAVVFKVEYMLTLILSGAGTELTHYLSHTMFFPHMLSSSLWSAPALALLVNKQPSFKAQDKPALT